LATSSIRPAIENMLLKEIQRKGEKWREDEYKDLRSY
jgi:hypothetical protein